MQGGAVDVGKIGVGGIEEQGEVGSREEDRVQVIAFDQSVREGGEVLVLLRRAVSVAQQLRIGVVDEVHFVGGRGDDLNVLQQAEETGLDGIAGAEDGEPAGGAGGDLRGDSVDQTDEWQRRRGEQFAGAVERSDRGKDGDFGPGGLEAAEEAVEVFGQAMGIAGLDVREDAGGLGVGDDDVEGAAAGFVGGGELAGSGWWLLLRAPPRRPAQRPLFIEGEGNGLFGTVQGRESFWMVSSRVLTS